MVGSIWVKKKAVPRFPMSYLHPSGSERSPILSSPGPEIGPVSRHSAPLVQSMSLSPSAWLSLFQAGAVLRPTESAPGLRLLPGPHGCSRENSRTNGASSCWGVGVVKGEIMLL